MAGREGGGGVVGQSHSNSEEEQTATDGTTDTNGVGRTLKFLFVHFLIGFVSLYSILYFSLYNFVSLLDFVFVSFSLCKLILLLSI